MKKIIIYNLFRLLTVCIVTIVSVTTKKYIEYKIYKQELAKK
jgi:hypothetical protein